jgi:hypothetical protein
MFGVIIFFGNVSRNRGKVIRHRDRQYDFHVSRYYRIQRKLGDMPVKSENDIPVCADTSQAMSRTNSNEQSADRVRLN